jgi:hypothetical protein
LCDDRRYPAILILWLAVSAFGVSFFVNLSVLVGGPVRTTCTWDDAQLPITMDNAHENDGQGVVCIMQAIGMYYFGLTCNTWWLAGTHSLSSASSSSRLSRLTNASASHDTVTINIFLMLCFTRQDWVRRWSRFIHYGYASHVRELSRFVFTAARICASLSLSRR